jgi:signal transduction histidine kinase
LIADDDAATLRILEVVLSRVGYRVIKATNGEEALRAFDSPETLPSIAVMDWNMPVLDGLEACVKIREKKLASHVYIILLTSQSRSEDVVVGLDSGADDFMSKPFEAKELCARIRVGERMVALEAAQKKLELEMGHMQKLEAVGRLAAGVAHEINTPMQFVNDSLTFVSEGMPELLSVFASLRSLRQAAESGEATVAAAQAAAALEAQLDLPYLLEQMPLALQRATDGVTRVTAIVRAMKDFARPDQSEKLAVDLNSAVMSTLTVASNEYKYVADVTTALGDIPHVVCHVGEINQVILNIIINAAHAIEDSVRGTDRKGAIHVSTRCEGDEVIIDIRDNAGGIPEPVRERVFDPFFTTKAIGKGSGQGLAISRAIVVEKHGGRLTFDTALGVGTTFHIGLPVAGGVAERA